MADDTETAQPTPEPKPKPEPKPRRARAKKAAPKAGADSAAAPDSVHAEAATESFLAQLVQQFTTAWCFFTRVPLPAWWNKGESDMGVEGQPKTRRRKAADKGQDDKGQDDKGLGLIPLTDTVRTWPVVGLFIGVAAGIVLWLGAWLGLSPLAAALLALGAAALVTGALHEDGLADVADGLGAGGDKERALAIMRDSHIGAFGVMALILTVGFKAACLAGFNAPELAARALIAAHALSRAALPMVMVVLQPARTDGLGKAAGTPKREDAVMAFVIGALIAVLALDFGPGLAASALAALTVAAVAWWAKRRLGGFTGDVLGAAQQMVDVAVLAGLAVAMRTVFYG